MIIRPDDIDLSKSLCGQFVDYGVARSAEYIIKLCQLNGSWRPFTKKEIDDVYQLDCPQCLFYWNGLISSGHVIETNGWYSLTELFVAKCYAATCDKTPITEEYMNSNKPGATEEIQESPYRDKILAMLGEIVADKGLRDMVLVERPGLSEDEISAAIQMSSHSAITALGLNRLRQEYSDEDLDRFSAVMVPHMDRKQAMQNEVIANVAFGSIESMRQIIEALR